MLSPKTTYTLGIVRTLCYDTPFGSMLYEKLSPVDISRFTCATYLSLSPGQKLKYMQMWRLFFTDRSWLTYMESLGHKIAFTGVDLVIPIAEVRNPNKKMVKPTVLDIGLCVYDPVRESNSVNWNVIAKTSSHMFNQQIRQSSLLKESVRPNSAIVVNDVDWLPCGVTITDVTNSEVEYRITAQYMLKIDPNSSSKSANQPDNVYFVSGKRL